ncbi:hypothetical protein L596_014579 [Steinernema carpocapsae]|uniref:Ubiquinone biosynthesis protein COQ4 homolog, mitochondrial n=1 Tax=Steinernema carpocapsae TaxID=34508 RepID=A0A4U5ND60_STECR|nr:hypothetical protein L596_014579 [Steinernema carpocapsae]
MASDVTGSRILKERPRINNMTIDREYLRRLPKDTFGFQYSKFLDDLSTSPDARPVVQYIDDEELVYVMQRYRETHDFHHVVLEMRPNMVGEVAVKWFEGIQLGLPMCVLGGSSVLPAWAQSIAGSSPNAICLGPSSKPQTVACLWRSTTRTTLTGRWPTSKPNATSRPSRTSGINRLLLYHHRCYKLRVIVERRHYKPWED